MQKKSKDISVNLSETFLSIQGEGPSMGVASYFIRFSGCSVRCKFCDTKYAWKGGQEKSVDEIIQEMSKLSNQFNLVVVTGGEPLEQPKGLYYLSWETYRLLRKKIEVETSLTANLSSSIVDNSLINWIVSPKDSEIMDVQKSTDPEAVRYLLKNGMRVYLKFVVSNQQDLKYWLEWAKKIDFPLDKIYVMPMAATPQELAEQCLWLPTEAIKYGVNFSYRLQIQIWGNQRRR